MIQRMHIGYYGNMIKQCKSDRGALSVNYFFVFQNKTFSEELKGKFLWAPKMTDKGHSKSHWSMMTKVKRGDRVIHSVNKEIVAISVAITDCYASPRPESGFGDWEKDGWKVDLEYNIFTNKIKTSDYIEELRDLQPKKYAPFNSIGRGNTGYLFAANWELFEFIVKKTAAVQTFENLRVQVLKLLKTEKDIIMEDQSYYGLEYPALDIDYEDYSYIEALGKLSFQHTDFKFEYSSRPKEKQAPEYRNGRKYYPRDKQTGLNALAHANYLCEIDRSHATFLRRNSYENYTEPHHLVPMAYSENFDVSLDIEENIVLLCSNCHNQLHYGEGMEELLRKLYLERKELLEKVEIKLSFKELLKLY